MLKLTNIFSPLAKIETTALALRIYTKDSLWSLAYYPFNENSCRDEINCKIILRHAWIPIIEQVKPIGKVYA